MPVSPALLMALLFLACLFAFASWIETRREAAGRHRRRWMAYAMALGVYCSSWTFYGAVGSAVADGWSYLPIYLGPIIVFAFAPGFLVRLVRAVRDEGATTISDFIGARFGKSRGLAALVTLTATLGIVPYVALQLRSIGTAFATLEQGGDMRLAMAGMAGILAAFALIFGTRRYDTAGRNEGLVYATAFESLVKIGALAAVAMLAAGLLLRLPPAMLAEAQAALATSFAPGRLGLEFVVLTLLSMAAIVCLPRQFYMAVVEAREPGDIRRARWPFMAYLATMTLLVLPVTLAGLAMAPAGTAPDLMVLALPLAQGAGEVAAFAFVGGVSAATAMVVVEAVALSTMVSNDIVAPLLLRGHRFKHSGDFGQVLLLVRRLAILAIVGMALLFALGVRADQGLASIGHIAFSAMALIAPLLLLAVLGRSQDAVAAKAGLAAGLLLWLYTLALPPVLPHEWLAALAGTTLDPLRLAGIGDAPPIVHGTFWSLGAEALAFALVAARKARPRRIGRRVRRAGTGLGGIETTGDLAALVSRFAGAERAAEAFAVLDPDRPVRANEARQAERLIAGVIGAPSARALLESALAGRRLGHEDVARMLDIGSRSLRFSHTLLSATLENIDPGVSVVDGDLRLIAWNSRYLELFDYPEGAVQVGTPVADLIRFNAERGECGPGEVDAHVERRLWHLRRGQPHSFERRRPDGRVIKTVGGPMQGGGYVMCFTDITAEAEARRALEEARALLERRVDQRTAALREANEQLAAATREKTRFLAAASHDLVQPLHAARLFAAALHRETTETGSVLLAKVEQSIAAGEQLLRTLLDISRFDAGGVEVRASRVVLRPLLAGVAEGFAAQAGAKGLRLALARGDAVVETDPALLRSAVQNLVSNAIRYTRSGGIVIGVRRRGSDVAIEVWDSGPGIPPDKLAAIFREFERLDNGEPGAGLGLAIVERTMRLLAGRVEVRSREGRGSRFALLLPAAHGFAAVASAPVPPMATPLPVPGGADRLAILVVDDDRRVLESMQALLERWGHGITTAAHADEALQIPGRFDVAVIDHDLGDGPDGLALARLLRARGKAVRVALVTANVAAELRHAAEAAQVPLFAKPLDVARFADWLAGRPAVAAAAE